MVIDRLGRFWKMHYQAVERVEVGEPRSVELLQEKAVKSSCSSAIELQSILYVYVSGCSTALYIQTMLRRALVYCTCSVHDALHFLLFIVFTHISTKPSLASESGNLLIA